MTKVPIDPLTLGFGSTNKLNSIFEDIEAALDNTLSRDGTGPNEMEANLDMNGHRILNLPAPNTDFEPLRKIDVIGGLEVTIGSDWADITNKPSTFAPSAHTHTTADVTGLSELIEDTIGTKVVAGTNVTVSYNDTTGQTTISSTASGGASDWSTLTGKPSTFEPTVESVQDIMATTLVAGTNVTLTYNDAGNTLTVASTGSGGTPDWSTITGKPSTFEPTIESVQDIVGAQLVAGSGVSVTYNDAAGTTTIANTAAAPDWSTLTGKPSTFEPVVESVQDIVGAQLIGGTGITVTYNDAGGTSTISNTGALVDLSNTQTQAAATAEILALPYIMNRELTLLKFIPYAQHAAILAGTSTVSHSTYIQEAFDEAQARGGAEILVEEGVFRSGTTLYVPSKTKLKGRGAGSIIRSLSTWAASGILAGGLYNNVMFANKNFLATALTDTDIILEDVTLDHNGVAYGDGHIWAMRYVDKPQRRFARFLNGGSATPSLACRDSLIIGCHAYNMGASYYDHWDGTGYQKVIGSTGRNPSGRGIQQGIQFTATGTNYEDRTTSVSLSMGNQIYGCRGTGYGSGDTAAAIIANGVDVGSFNYNFKSIGDYVEDADIGLVFGGKGGQHEATNITLKNVTTVPILIQDEGTNEAPSNCVVDGAHMINCAYTVANPAFVSIGGGAGHTIKGLKFTTCTGSTHVWMATATSNIKLHPIDLATGSAVINNTGTNNTIHSYGGSTLLTTGNDGSAYTDLYAPGMTYRLRVRDAGSLSINGSFLASTTVNATTDMSLGSSGLIVFGSGSGYWLQRLGSHVYWREPVGPTIIQLD